MFRRATEIRRFKQNDVDVVKEVNVATLVGNLVTDAPELRNVNVNGKDKIAIGGGNFSIAINRGQDKPTIFVKIEAWDVIAERLAKVAKKGKTVVLIGEIKDASYENKDKVMVSQEKIIVSDFQMIYTGGAKTNEAKDDFAGDAAGNPDDGNYNFQPVGDEDYDDVPF